MPVLARNADRCLSAVKRSSKTSAPSLLMPTTFARVERSLIRFSRNEMMPMVTNATDARRRVMPLVQRMMKISFCLMEVLNATHCNYSSRFWTMSADIRSWELNFRPADSAASRLTSNRS